MSILRYLRTTTKDESFNRMRLKLYPELQLEQISLCVIFMYLEVFKKQKQWITFKVSELEMNAIENYCGQTQRTKTDVLRELIRRLPTYTNSSNSRNTSHDK